MKIKLKRDLTAKLNWWLDQWLPPAVRDCPLIMRPLFRLLFGPQAHLFWQFKLQSPFLTHDDYKHYYQQLAAVHLDRPTDLNRACLSQILHDIKGKKVLDVGCGRAYLLHQIAKTYPDKQLSGFDIYIDDQLRQKYPQIKFQTGNVESLPFPDNSFDTVICTHTLEHVQHPQQVIAQLRRVAKKQVIIVVPRQREYLYTFDLHLNFFPYPHDLLRLTANPKGKYQLLGNDIYYQENPKDLS